jgi:hypothetical protein
MKGNLMEDNCHVDLYEKEVRAEDLEKAQVAHLAVAGMGCPRCALRVQNGLNGSVKSIV